MRKELNLNDEDFAALAEEAKNRIVSYYPQWTDYNYHDPGITILELFAFLKEIQLYRINFVGEKHKQKYLKLLGIQKRHMSPSRVQVKIQSKKTLLLPGLTRFYASQIGFESSQPKLLIADDIKCCIYQEESGAGIVDRKQMGSDRALHIPVFGKAAERGSCFYIGFEEALPTGQELSLFAEVWNEYETKRSLIEKAISFFPLAELSFEFYGSRGFTKIKQVQDETYGFLQSGPITFFLEENMKPAAIKGQEGYFLRIVLKNSMYDVPPVLTGITMNMTEAVQRMHYALCQDIPYKTTDGWGSCRIGKNSLNMENIAVLLKKGNKCRLLDNYDYTEEENRIKISFPLEVCQEEPDCVRILSWSFFFDAGQILGKGNGMPRQEFKLEETSLLYDSFQIMIEEPGEEGVFYDWEKAEDFIGSSPMDRHYVLDLEKGCLLFGDGIHGMVPRGRIIITQYVTSKGMDGNVTAGKISRMEEKYRFLKVLNKKDASGGDAEESLEHCFMRAQEQIQVNGGFVTSADYEEAVKRTPGLMIASCRAIFLETEEKKGEQEKGEVVTIAVKPFSNKKNPGLSQAYLDNMEAWLEQGRMIGTKLHLISPEYIKIHLFIEGNGKNNFIYDKEKIIEALETYFHPFASRFGGTVSYSAIYELLDMLPVLSQVGALSIDAVGKVKRTFAGDVILPPNGLISPEDIEYNININED